MNIAFKKIVPSDPNLIPEVDEFIFDKITSLNLKENTLSNLSLALSEALSNAMVHGNKLDPNKDVIVSIKISNDELILCIKDEGNGFDPDSVPDPTKPENIMRDSGRGIHIMRSFIDQVSYNFSSVGTELKFVINLKK
ncbi:MAG: ATP-binding protein [Melioribacteraceae bacterium]|nr:ATP-binding protein [Melioribacteraceae bacterium]